MQDVYSHEDPLVTILVSAAVITLFTLSYLASMAARCRACQVNQTATLRLVTPRQAARSLRCLVCATALSRAPDHCSRNQPRAPSV